jgi:hypothetical protein
MQEMFTDDVLSLISDTKEVHIETRSGDRSYQTVIWIVVNHNNVFCRSVRGESGKWYQRTLRDPNVRLHVGDWVLDAMSVPAHDPESIERASEALRRKYPRGRSLDAMLMSETLGTTIRLEPREPTTS